MMQADEFVMDKFFELENLTRVEKVEGGVKEEGSYLELDPERVGHMVFLKCCFHPWPYTPSHVRMFVCMYTTLQETVILFGLVQA